MAHRALVAGRGDERRAMAWWFWVLRGADSVVVVDCGCADAAQAERWEISGFRRIDEILPTLGIAPQDVGALVLTHGHWDHAGAAGLLPNARVLIRQRELDWWRAEVEAHGGERSGLRAEDLAEISDRAEALGDEEVEPWPGVRLIPGGGHTPGSQWVRVGDVALASDNAYLYDNLEGPTPVGACFDEAANLAALRDIAGCAHVAPGHDPAVAERYPEVTPGIYLIG